MKGGESSFDLILNQLETLADISVTAFARLHPLHVLNRILCRLENIDSVLQGPRDS